MDVSQDEELLFESLRLELRRGSLILAVLASLRREQYGYSLRVALGEVGVEMEESTLYPLLRRLESQGLLDSEWREEERRKKRFYRLSPRGELYGKENIRELLDMRNFMDTLRNTGVDTGGPAAFGAADRQAFANRLDRLLLRRR